MLKIVDKKLLSLVFFITTILSCNSVTAKSFKIDMVLWRGMTSADKAFLDTIKADGLAQDVNIFNAKQDKARLLDIRHNIQASPPDLLYLFGTTVTLSFAGKSDGTGLPGPEFHIPMIFNIVANPVGSKIVKNYGPSGRNITGVSHTVPLKVQAKVIHDLGVKNVAALYNPAESNSIVTLKELSRYLARYQIKLQKFAITENDNNQLTNWDSQVQNLQKSKIDLVYLPSDSLIISHAQKIVSALNAKHLATFSATESPISKGGALMGVISHYSAAGRRAAIIAEQILRNNRPAGTIPISTPSSYLFLVNQNTMNQLQFYPPIPLLRFAQFVTTPESPKASN